MGLTEKEILNLINENPSEGLKQVLMLYGSSLKTICINILGSDAREDIEECISDTLLELWKNRDRICPDQGSLKSYLYGIIRHKAIDRRRVNENLPQSTFQVGGYEAEPDAFSGSVEGLIMEADFAEDLTRRENAVLVQSAVDQLPEPDREIFIRRYFFFERVADIAACLGMTGKAVEGRLYRGKEKLKQKLLERGIVL